LREHASGNSYGSCKTPATLTRIQDTDKNVQRRAIKERIASAALVLPCQQAAASAAAAATTIRLHTALDRNGRDTPANMTVRHVGRRF